MITRLGLLRKAALVIGRDGSAGASLRAIAREAGVSLSTLQHHFPTKDTLWRAIIDELVMPRMETEHLGGVSAKSEGLDPRSMVTTTIANRLSTVASRPGISGQLLHDASPAGEERLHYLAERTDPLRTRNRRLLNSMIEDGTLRSVGVDALIILLSMAIPSLSSANHAVKVLVGPDLSDEDDQRRISAELTDILLYGLLPRRDEASNAVQGPV